MHSSNLMHARLCIFHASIIIEGFPRLQMSERVKNKPKVTSSSLSPRISPLIYSFCFSKLFILRSTAFMYSVVVT